MRFGPDKLLITPYPFSPGKAEAAEVLKSIIAWGSIGGPVLALVDLAEEIETQQSPASEVPTTAG